MKIVIQRVDEAMVTVANENESNNVGVDVSVDPQIVGKIGQGFLILLGVGPEDDKEKVDYLVEKICNLRVFKDENDKMNLSLKDINGDILVVSQFTLYADCRKGNRPSFTEAASPAKAEELYEYFKTKCAEKIANVQSGIFGAHMKVSLLNNGPVTIILEK